MAEREWKPGDVATIPFSRGWVRCIYTPEGWVPSDNNSDPAVKGYEDVRPLVVIDPEDREQVERFTHLFLSHHWGPDHQTHTDAGQAALREFASPTPPKPDEPMGLGAVVEDEDGDEWVRVARKSGNSWWRPIGTYARYADIAVVRVLAEGVRP